MSVAVGLLLGLGLLLAASPWLWPVAAGSQAASSQTPDSPLEGMRARLRQAGLGQVPLALLVVVSALLGIAAAATASALSPVLALAVAAGVVAAALPFVIVAGRARARSRATRAVWPDLVDHLVSGLRSGLPLTESLAALAHTGSTETREVFAAFDRELRASGNLGVALDGLKLRLSDPVADRIVETLRMSREVGGAELPQVLRNLAAWLRQDAALRAEVEARQGWIRTAARLGVAAPWVVLLLLSSRPEAASAYNSPLGLGLLAVGLVITVVAYRIMLAVGRLPEERRWFA